MMFARPLAVLLGLGLAALVSVLAAAGPKAHGATTCATRTAWAGTESTALHDDTMLVQVPLTIPVIVTGVTVSSGMASSAPGFAEQLVLAGVSDGPLTTDPDRIPILPADPTFAPLDISAGAPTNGQTAMESGILLAQIVKANDGAGDFTRTVSGSWPVPAGGVVWVFTGVDGQPADPEVQTVVSYVPAGC